MNAFRNAFDAMFQRTANHVMAGPFTGLKRQAGSRAAPLMLSSDDDEVQFLGSQPAKKKRAYEELDELPDAPPLKKQKSGLFKPQKQPSSKKRRSIELDEQPNEPSLGNSNTELPKARKKLPKKTRKLKLPDQTKSGRKHPVKECIICCEELPTYHFPGEAPHKPGQECNSSVCFSCFEQHLQNEVDSKKWNEIKCPECAQVLEEQEIKALALEATYMQ